MADKKYYCFCETGCKYETMSKEQILTAITQAVQNGTVGNCDTGFIQTIKTVNGLPLRFFVGTQYDYEALEDKENLFAIITNDATTSGILEAIEELETNFEELVQFLIDGEIVVKKAEIAIKNEKNERIVETYARKDEKKIFNANLNFARVKKGTEFKIGSLPTGKALGDIVGIGMAMCFVDDLYPEYTADLYFSCGRTDLVTNYNSKRVLSFFLRTSALAEYEYIVISEMDVSIIEKSGDLYLVFNRGSYKKIGGNNTSGDFFDLNSDGFEIDQVIYWFA